MSKKSIIIVIGLIALLGAGVFVWRAEDARAKSEKVESQILKGLTSEEISVILQSQAGSDASGISDIYASGESRKAFLKGMKEYLALAALARREGLAEEPGFKVNFEYKKNTLFADLYRAKLSKGQGKYYVVPNEELDAVWQNPANEKQFEIDMETLRAIQIAVAKERGDQGAYGKLQGGALEKARKNWANSKVLAEKAKADQAFMGLPEIALRVRILEAGILSADYLRKHWGDKIKASGKEIADYLASNPQYDPKKKKEKAEALLKRALAGEDFAKLAAENSEDRTTKSKGGLYENISKDYIWAEVEAAALALNKGETGSSIVESNAGYHIIKLENKEEKKAADGSDGFSFSVRHILLQKGFEDPSHTNPDIPAPFIDSNELAKSQIEIEKRNKFVSGIVEASGISMPEEFTAEIPAAVKAVN